MKLKDISFKAEKEKMNMCLGIRKSWWLRALNDIELTAWVQLQSLRCVLFISSVPVVSADPPHEATAEIAAPQQPAAEHHRGTNLHYKDTVRGLWDFSAPEEIILLIRIKTS